VVLYARGAAGANVAIVPLAFSVTVPTTANIAGACDREGRVNENSSAR